MTVSIKGERPSLLWNPLSETSSPGRSDRQVPRDLLYLSKRRIFKSRFSSLSYFYVVSCYVSSSLLTDYFELFHVAFNLFVFNFKCVYLLLVLLVSPSLWCIILKLFLQSVSSRLSLKGASKSCYINKTYRCSHGIKKRGGCLTVVVQVSWINCVLVYCDLNIADI